MTRAHLDVWALDECHFQQHGSRCTMWIPPEDVDPTLLHACTHRQVGVFGAVRLCNGQFVAQRQPTLNAETFLAFLHKLSRHRRPSKTLRIVLDNSAYHHAQLLRPWLSRHRNALQLEFLPPYSPDLNPIERVWKLTRRLCVHNRYFPTLDSLVDAVSDQFAAWAKSNAILRRLCAIT
jgi:transposase